MSRQAEIIAAAERFGARNYAPLPIVLAEGDGVWVWDADGTRYLDCLSAYSALNQGHRHPRIVAALVEQANRITLTSRAFHNDRMGRFLETLCRLCGMEMALPMNTGAEAVETAIKAARKWGYTVKGVPADKAEIVVCNNNFHGRTTTVSGLSSEAWYRDGFGPYDGGFRLVDFGDAEQLAAAITPNTVAFLVEPIQGEGGVIVPPEGYLGRARALCREHDVLFVLDEIQTGLGRTGALFCYQHEADAKPDLLLLGKALGGGVYPVSAAVGSAAVLGVFEPGQHGSTFGGNPLAAAVGEAALAVIVDEGLAERSARLGRRLIDGINAIQTWKIREVRGKGLFVGIEVAPEAGPARAFCERLIAHGVLCKETRERVVRLAPPLIIEDAEIDGLVAALRAVFLDDP